MKNRERAVWIAAIALLAAANLRRCDTHEARTSRPRAQPGVRLSMDALHRQGGVPIGWQMSLSPGDVAAGRRAFADFGCPACHRVAGESFSPPDAAGLGPELSGMGSHHPAAYFAEAILNPDAVLIDAPGWVGADGLSKMPLYPDMTAAELADIVAYLGSLRDEAPANCHDPGTAAATLAARVDLSARPQPPAETARRFFMQSYDVLPGRLAAFEQWFAREGRPRFLAADGLLGFDTYVDATRAAGAVTSLLAFRDEAALRNFLGDPATAALWQQFDSFVGPHAHATFDRPPIYRAPALSAE
jgi:mono/diheme cytochrome c family protein